MIALQFLKLLNSGESHVSARLILADRLFISEVESRNVGQIMRKTHGIFCV